MKYIILVERYAQKQIMKLNKEEIPLIKEAIASLASNPRPTGCKKLKGEPAWRIRVGNYRVIYEIDNLAFIIEQLLEKNVPSGIYNISDDEPLSTIELIRLIARLMDKPVRIWDLSPKLIFWLAKIGTVIHFPLNTERMKKLTEDYVVSNAKIKKALGINQMPVSAIEGFTKTIKSFEKK